METVILPFELESPDSKINALADIRVLKMLAFLFFIVILQHSLSDIFIDNY